MKRHALILVGVATALFALSGCADEAGDKLLGGERAVNTDPQDTVGSEGTTFDHDREGQGGDNGLTDPAIKRAQDATIGSAEVVARLHAAQKISVAALNAMLVDMGVNIQANAQNNQPQTAGQLYRGGLSALGAPIYSSRSPEAVNPTTASLAKQFDIYTAAAPEIMANLGKGKRCPGVVLIADNKFTEDGISCLIGKPARAEHVALANNLVAQAADPVTGQRLAVSALLAAAHTSE
jgi:hypothetical protein